MKLSFPYTKLANPLPDVQTADKPLHCTVIEKKGLWYPAQSFKSGKIKYIVRIGQNSLGCKNKNLAIQLSKALAFEQNIPCKI